VRREAGDEEGGSLVVLVLVTVVGVVGVAGLSGRGFR